MHNCDHGESVIEYECDDFIPIHSDIWTISRQNCTGQVKFNCELPSIINYYVFIIDGRQYFEISGAWTHLEKSIAFVKYTRATEV